MREMITAASAAGVAVAFGSPIGGVLFSIEEMSHTFSIKTMWRSFFCALVATVTLSAMNPFRTGKLVLFQVTYDRDWHFFEIIFFIIIGIFGGLYGALVVKFNLQYAAFRRKHLVNYGVTEAVILATLTAMFGFFNKFLRIDMTEMLYILFRECESGGDYDNLCQTAYQWPMVNSLFLATIFRIGFVIVSYGAKVPAGIFVPSMAIGATFGRMLGILVKAIYRAYPTSGIFAACQPDIPCITPGTYAFLGAAAALSGVMRITVTVVVIMFELTGALTYILPTMIVLLVTKAVGDFFDRSGIADEMIRFNGYPYLDKDEHTFHIAGGFCSNFSRDFPRGRGFGSFKWLIWGRSHTVSRVMKKELYTMSVNGMRLQDVEEKLDNTQVQGFPIVSPDSSRTLLGYIGRTELKYVIQKAKKTRLIRQDTLCTFAATAPPDQYDQFDEDSHATTRLVDADLSGGIDEDDNVEMLATSSTSDVLNVSPWVNHTPITVAPQLPLEVVMQIFKRLGPRVILVEQYGSLVGLITVKDVLRFIASNRQTHTRSRSNSVSVLDTTRGSLDGLLEEAWTWMTEYTDRVQEWARRLVAR
ncbi:glycerol ethanol, ferric requiring protein [Tulasnella sp. 419]|nr:glycerol ethanol, ferric requiring protein [Tulasnella sp. 419]